MSFCVVCRKGATGCPMLLCRSADRSWQFLKCPSLAISVSVLNASKHLYAQRRPRVKGSAIPPVFNGVQIYKPRAAKEGFPFVRNSWRVLDANVEVVTPKRLMQSLEPPSRLYVSSLSTIWRELRRVPDWQARCNTGLRIGAEEQTCG